MAESQTVQDETQQTASAAAGIDSGTEVRQMELNSVAPTQPSGQENLDMLLDIQMPIIVTLGRAEVPLKKLLQLAPGAVLTLDKSFGQPAELFVQGIPVATADVVVVDNNFAVRIRELISSDEVKSPAAPKQVG
jgi:flagellar motor switch protein FliN/FliY